MKQRSTPGLAIAGQRELGDGNGVVVKEQGSHAHLGEKLGLAQGGPSWPGHAYRRWRWDGFTTMSCGGGGKADTVVLELRQARGVAAELEASSA